MWARESAQIIHPTRGRIPFEPYPYQARLLLDRSPRRLIVKARQIGVSQAAALEALHGAIYEPDSTTLFVSRNGQLAVNLLGYCYTTYDSLPPGRAPALTRTNQEELVLANGSRILSLPANRSTGRGFAGRRVYLDEYAYQEYAADIYRSVSPILGHGGRLTVLSTPDGRANHFYQLWAGIEAGEWSRHVLPWRECPAYDAAWYERERPKYTAQQWASEYECDFVASGQAVFRAEDVEACAAGWLGLQEPAAGRKYVTAWDIGQHDATVGVTLDTTDSETLQVVAFERLLGASYPHIQSRIAARARSYGGVTYVESNGPGQTVAENLDVIVRGWATTAKSKQQMVTSLALAHESRRLKHDIPQVRLECLLYQWDDKNLIQDCVMALAIAVHNASAGAEAVAATRSFW